MISTGLEEAAPGQAALHEYVSPERGWCRRELQPWKAAGTDQVTEICQKDPVPWRQLDEELQLRNRDFWLDVYHLNGAQSAHLSMLDGYGRSVVAEGTSKAYGLSGFSRGR